MFKLVIITAILLAILDVHKVACEDLTQVEALTKCYSLAQEKNDSKMVAVCEQIKNASDEDFKKKWLPKIKAWQRRSSRKG